MADKRNPYHYDPEYYVHGSTVRKLNVEEQARKHSQKSKAGKGNAKNSRVGHARSLEQEPQYESPVRKKLPQSEPDRYERLREQENKRNEKKILPISRGVNFFGILLLCGAMCCMGLLCVRYLDLKAESTRLDKAISGLKDDLDVLLDVNAGKEEALVENIDLEAIYQTAVGEFGMVFPNHNEIIYFDMADLSYVRQYADIPEAAASILDKLVP